ncbi:DUF4345 domain-containing protein [Sphingomonas sanguinis]|jgi:hypothetical protein|uniref:DUF4345 domain-containing protein n=1 Tax=Sphingomonas sanguinis TaxID=33051 RepID=A0A7Y7QVW7_9SPHN|nr:DUF4345 domain-containing protein [Sphingomonas sanguinis]MBZ6382373.1 DUF4345 domain-containing protein [Sphingomonas sanguinis]NNG50566.1 DUF4345 domain-containing protein [Sphingomonas sanguinis]NNG54644.1 DUF4345 domain-containing protein [Sphingomonas sanguinis]NVP31672.1 DUF4345 domain-containing protein [Sphingomonas sanguinis]
MSSQAERRALQVVVAIACLVPLGIGGISVVRGPDWLGHAPVIPTDLDSQFRYVSGIFFALGLAFTSCVPAIERKGARFRLLGLLVVVGGLARMLSWASIGAPSVGHRFGLVMELGVVPLLMLWQARVARATR